MKNTIAHSLFALALFAAASMTALAEDAQSKGIITINGGRTTVAMRSLSNNTSATKHTTGSSGHAVPAPPPAGEIFDNYQQPGFLCANGTGWTVSGPASAPGQAWIASAFTPAKTARLHRIYIAVGFVAGAVNGVTVKLAKDAAGLPGAVMETWNLAALPAFGAGCPTDVAVSVRRPTLKKKVQYWLIARTNAATVGTWDAWNLNSIGDVGPLASNAGAGWVAAGMQTRGAFAVYK